jgi:hypothetical protein
VENVICLWGSVPKSLKTFEYHFSFCCSWLAYWRLKDHWRSKPSRLLEHIYVLYIFTCTSPTVSVKPLESIERFYLDLELSIVTGLPQNVIQYATAYRCLGSTADAESNIMIIMSTACPVSKCQEF